MSTSPVTQVTPEIPISTTEPAVPEFTPQDAQAAFAMPIEQLREAAFGNEQATEQPAPAPNPFGNYQTSEHVSFAQENGQYLIKYRTGNVFKGNTPEEAIAKALEGASRTAEWGRAIKSSLNGKPMPNVTMPEYLADGSTSEQTTAPQSQQDISQFPPEPSFSETVVITPEQEKQLAQEFFRTAITPDVAKELGTQALSHALQVPPEALPNVVNEFVTATRNFQLETTYLDFCRTCPDYYETPQNMQAVLSFLPSILPQGANRLPNATDLRNAWALARYTGQGNPLPKITPPEPIRHPVPMPGSVASPSNASAGNPWEMPMDQLQQAAFGGRH